MNKLDEFNMADILPTSIEEDENIQALAEIFTYEVLQLVPSINRLLLLPNLSKLPDAVLDHLAWQYHVDFYEQASTRHEKEQLIYQSLAWHRKKGTVGIVEDMAKLLTDYAEVTEYWDYDGEPYHFKITIESNENYDTDEVKRVVNAIEQVKNARSWLDGIEFRRFYEPKIYVGGRTAFSNTEITVPVKRVNDITNKMSYGGRIALQTVEWGY